MQVPLVGLLLSMYSCGEVTLTASQNEHDFICLTGLPSACSCDGNTRGSLKMEKTCLTFIFIHLQALWSHFNILSSCSVIRAIDSHVHTYIVVKRSDIYILLVMAQMDQLRLNLIYELWCYHCEHKYQIWQRTLPYFSRYMRYVYGDIPNFFFIFHQISHIVIRKKNP